MDFVSDKLADGRSFRILTVVDQFTRECVELPQPAPLNRALGAGHVGESAMVREQAFLGIVVPGNELLPVRGGRSPGRPRRTGHGLWPRRQNPLLRLRNIPLLIPYRALWTLRRHLLRLLSLVSPVRPWQIRPPGRLPTASQEENRLAEYGHFVLLLSRAHALL
jgi:hypothetical protein